MGLNIRTGEEPPLITISMVGGKLTTRKSYFGIMVTLLVTNGNLIMSHVFYPNLIMSHVFYPNLIMSHGFYPNATRAALTDESET